MTTGNPLKLMKAGFELTAQEHLDAEDLINEVQDRLEGLRAKGGRHITKRSNPWLYEPDLYVIELEDDRLLIKVSQNSFSVSHNGKFVLVLTGLNIDGIDLKGLNTALTNVRRHMVLDDLANI